MAIELGEYHDKDHLKELIDRFSPAQLESLQRFMSILEKGFSSERGPEGQVIRGFLNMKIEKASEKKTISTLPIRWEMYNGIGVIHGGITATAIDDAMGKTLRVCQSGELARQVTVDLNIHYLKGGKGKELMIETEIIQAGRSLAVLESTVRDDQGDMVAKATGTFRVWQKK